MEAASERAEEDPASLRAAGSPCVAADGEEDGLTLLVQPGPPRKNSNPALAISRLDTARGAKTWPTAASGPLKRRRPFDFFLPPCAGHLASSPRVRRGKWASYSLLGLSSLGLHAAWPSGQKTGCLSSPGPLRALRVAARSGEKGER